ncbi:MAG TPA: substrate-binding domain-containing protein [Solirubrobacterales bacterium]
MPAFKQKLTKTGARAALLASAIAAMLAISGVGASSASAACTGTIVGQGASLQNVAQNEIWIPHFNKEVCEGAEGSKTRKPEYISTGSGPGLKAWGFTAMEGVNKERHFIGTDDAPAAAQITTAREQANNANVLVVPVAQTAIAVVANPPASCTITEITNKDLENAMDGTITKWSELSTASGAGCTGSLTRVVRAEGSGTTFQFKNYLSKISANLPCTTEGKTKWSELQEIGTEEKPNITWPTCAGKTAPVTGAGGSGVVKAVTATANNGRIGYAALPDAKNPANGTPVILKVQNAEAGGEPTGFAAPGVEEEESGKKGNANCAKAVYAVPAAGQTSGSGENVDWSGVFGGNPKIAGTTYPICTLTYDLAWDDYKTAGYTSGEEVGKSVTHYIHTIVTNPTVPTVKKWYAALPAGTGESSNVQMAAEYASLQIQMP